MSAEEARERQRAEAEARERRRIEERKRMYLQQERAKELNKPSSSPTRTSSSRTAATVQSSVFDEDSHLFGSSSRSGAAAARRRTSSRGGSGAGKGSNPVADSREDRGMFQDIGFLLAETCPAMLPPEISPAASNGTSKTATTAPKTLGRNPQRSTRVPSSGSAALRLPPCVVCQSGARTHVASPCLHLAYCGACAGRMPPRCAVCHRSAEFRPVSL
jgi:hypothetical protein